MSSSARASTEGGIARPSALAVLRLIASSNFVGCSMGRSPGLAPFRICRLDRAAPRVRPHSGQLRSAPAHPRAPRSHPLSEIPDPGADPPRQPPPQGPGGRGDQAHLGRHQPPRRLLARHARRPRHRHHGSRGASLIGPAARCARSCRPYGGRWSPASTPTTPSSSANSSPTSTTWTKLSRPSAPSTPPWRPLPPGSIPSPA